MFHNLIIMKIKRLNLLHIVNKLNTLFTSFGASQEALDLKLSTEIVKILMRWVSCEGHHGLKRFKTMSWYFTRHSVGILEPIPFSSIYKRPFSKALFLSKNSILTRVYWISVFNLHRLVKLKPVIDTSTITSGFKGSLWRLASHSLSLYRVTLSFRSVVDQNWSAKWKWHISGASGPNGSVAYTRYLDDLYAIRQEWILQKNFLLLWSLPLSNKEETFESLRDVLKEVDNRPKNDKQPIHSRLTFLSDKSGKTRVVAIVDIFSQSCLKMVHQRCNRILRRLSETDGTFDQDKQRRRVLRWTEDNVFLASIDLTAVTDRLPVLYQVSVLIGTRILTPLQALGWFLVTTKRSFLVKGKYPKFVRYAVGQPMGALSSWPVMAISHHVLVWWSYKLAYPNSDPRYFKDYCILGDDLVIRDKATSEKYLELISALGVDYSLEKSFFSKGLAEFAKSIFLRGNDLSPFPLGALDFKKNTMCSNLQVLLTECSKRHLRTTLSTLLGISPRRWRKLATYTALSPLNPHSVLDVQPRKDHGIFLSFLLIQRIRYFSRLKTLEDSIHAFMSNDPIPLLKGSPFTQIGLDNSERYPVRRLRDDDRLIEPVPVLGSGWISYCSQAWPNGLPSLDDEKLVPGPTWQKEIDDAIVTSSLLKLEKFLPGYFTTRCVGKQVGD